LTAIPLSNPPPNYKLLNHQYDTLDDLVDDLHNWSAQALFGIKKLRACNPVKGLGYTRVDFYCLRDKIRPSEAFTGRTSSTTKTGCSWLVRAKALTSNNRKWTLEIPEDYVAHNHTPAEGREDIATIRKFKPEHIAFIASFVNRPTITNRQLTEALRNKFPSILFVRKQLRNQRYRLQKDTQDGYTPVQGTIKLLDERGVLYKVL
jgi:hypothetical protein